MAAKRKPNPARLPTNKSELLGRIREVLLEMLPEALASFLTLGIIAPGRVLFEWWLGEDAKFFGVVPISWVTDAGDISFACSADLANVEKIQWLKSLLMRPRTI